MDRAEIKGWKPTFEGKFAGFHITMNVIDSQLIISLKSEIEEFIINIDQQTISNSNYSMFIENPLELSAFIAEKIKKKKITIEKDGTIEMEMKTQVKKSVKMRFEAVRKEMSKSQINKRKIDKLQQQVKELKQKNQFLENNLLIQQQKVKILKKVLQKDKTTKKQTRFSIDWASTDTSKYGEDNKKVKKLSNGWDNLVGRVICSSLNSYEVKLIKSSSTNGILFGICSTSIKSIKEAWRTNQCICYCGKDGSICTQGKSLKTNGDIINIGDIIGVKVSLSNNAVAWFKNGIKIIQWPLPSKLENKKIVQLIIMPSKDDAIQLLN